YGATRYETSLKIAEQLGSVNEIFVTSANGYADSLSVAAIAAKKGAPIVFTDKNELKGSVKQYISKVNGKKVFLIGGKGVVSDNAVKGISNLERISGQDRFETNKNVLQGFKSDINFDNVYVVKGAGPKGNEFADALSCSALAAQKAAPIILTNNDIKSELKDFVNNNIISSSNITAVGGESVVPSSILDKLEAKVEVTEINKDNSVFGEEKTEKVINGDLLIKGNKVTLQNLKVNGVITVDPGEKGSTDIKNVTANTIVVKSGAENSIHLFNSKAENLIVDSKRNVRVELKENSSINNTTVKSNTILDNIKGNFGNVLIESKEDADKNKVVLKGKFDKTVHVNGKTNVDFNGDFAEVKISKEAKINIENGSKVEKISANSKCDIKIESGATVNKVEKGNNNVKIDKSISSSSGRGSSSGGSSGGNTKPEQPSDNKFEVNKNGDKVQIKIKNKEDVEVTLTVYNSNDSLVYIGQDVLKNGETQFNTVLENGKYHGFYKFENGEKVKVEFEIK
uniref:cell wall-binding repeat-containing protein n=1 Tax=Clostridium lundense TaxID=319475 RepID=UPI000A034E24